MRNCVLWIANQAPLPDRLHCDLNCLPRPSENINPQPNPIATLLKIASIQSSVGTNSKSQPAAATAKILVIDDEADVRNVLRDVLSAAGYIIVTASDGREALPLTLKDKPDLILSDIRMPKLDGLTLCKALRVNPETKSIPVIMLTSYNTSEQMEAAMTAGADDFLTKPLNMEEVKIRVRSMLKLKNITDEVQRLQQYVLALRQEAGDPPSTK